MERQQPVVLELSAKIEYALLAMIELASQPKPINPLTSAEIAAKQPIPVRYLDQVLMILRRGGLIQGQRGSRGGYMLAREPWQITVLEIVDLVMGDRRNRETAQSTVERDLLREVWVEVVSASQGVFSRFTLQDLCHRRDLRRLGRPMYYI